MLARGWHHNSSRWTLGGVACADHTSDCNCEVWKAWADGIHTPNDNLLN